MCSRIFSTNARFWPATASMQSSLDALRAASDTSNFKDSDALWVKVVASGDRETASLSPIAVTNLRHSTRMRSVRSVRLKSTLRSSKQCRDARHGLARVRHRAGCGLYRAAGVLAAPAGNDAALPKTSQRDKLGRLARYVARPPVANARKIAETPGTSGAVRLLERVALDAWDRHRLF